MLNLKGNYYLVKYNWDEVLFYLSLGLGLWNMLDLSKKKIVIYWISKLNINYILIYELCKIIFYFELNVVCIYL